MNDLLVKILSKRYFLNPIFVVGASRSGTSVLLQALGKHPYILSMPGESPFITSMGGAAYLFEFAENKDYYLESIKIPKEYLYYYLRRISFEVACGRNYGFKMIIKEIVKGNVSFLRKRYWCAKTFPNFNVAKGLLQLYPRTKFIYIIRNGYDVIHSMSRFSGFCHQDFEKDCKAWVNSAKNFDYLQGLDSSILVRYEQLVENPNMAFQNIFSFLGIDHHEGPINFVKNTLIHPLDRPTQTNINVKDVLSNRKPSYEDWSIEQIELFKKICGDTMLRLGYKMSS